MSPNQVAGAIAETGRLRLVGIIAVVLPGLALLQVLGNAGDYRQPAVVIAVWIGVLGAAAWLTPWMRARPLSPAETAAAITIALAAVVVVGAEHQAQIMPGSVDLAIAGTLWLLVVVLLNAPRWVSISTAATVYAAHSALLIRAEGVHSLTLSELEAAGYITAALLIAFAVLRPSIAVHASVAARRASLASRTAAERAAATAIGQERRRRLAVLEKEALPLLRGVADGTLDPTSADVRDRCARHAAILRHSLTGQTPDAGELTDRLEPALLAARERGLLVAVQLIGDPPTAHPAIAHAVVTTVGGVLRALPPQPVTLTVLAAGEDVELYLAFDTPPDDAALSGLANLTGPGGPTGPAEPAEPAGPTGLPAAARWHATLNAAEAGGYLEISWRKDDAA